MELKRIRLSKGMTQKEVADLLKCSPVVYSRYETGARQPSLDLLIRLSEIFGITTDELLGVGFDRAEGLNAFENALIEASRSADDRAKEDALLLLRIHSGQAGK